MKGEKRVLRFYPDQDAALTTYTLPDQEGSTMSARQYNGVKALIKGLCDNYDKSTGLCLPLDCPCPQLSSYSLICRYFKEAVLPADKELCAEVMGTGGIKTCAVCSKPFRAVSNRAKYCKRCAEKVRRKQDAERKRAKRVSSVCI